MSTVATVSLPIPHDEQVRFIDSTSKRKVIRAGRRGGKTVGVGILAAEKFLAGKRVLYAAPTSDQLYAFWDSIKVAFQEPIELGVFIKNESSHTLIHPTLGWRIKAKTAWNADTLRGDWADVLILDEWQLMDEEAWDRVGAPMLLDNDGDAVFIYTPPSLASRSVSKARDPQHAAKLFRRAAKDTTGRWATFNFSSAKNPHISEIALGLIAGDMTALAYRQEILAEDVDEAPGALWTRENLEVNRTFEDVEYDLVAVGVDPSTTSAGDETGIVVGGKKGDHFFTVADHSMQGSPAAWATQAVSAYHAHEANYIVAESNQGGEMVSQVIHEVDPTVPVKLVHASRGKQARAQPIAAIYEKGRGHHNGTFHKLEDEMCMWVPGDPSPNRMDALVWAASKLMIGKSSKIKSAENPFYA